MFALTEQQKACFETFGFLSFPGLMQDCIGEIMDVFELIWDDHGGGHGGQVHDGKQRSCIWNKGWHTMGIWQRWRPRRVLKY